MPFGTCLYFKFQVYFLSYTNSKQTAVDQFYNYCRPYPQNAGKCMQDTIESKASISLFCVFIRGPFARH